MFWVNAFKCQVHKCGVTAKYMTSKFCDTASACTIVGVFCCVILSVPVPMCQCSIVWHCQCLNNVGVFCCVIMSVPVPMCQCSVVWYCQCLNNVGVFCCVILSVPYQCDSAMLCGTVSACTNVAVLCYVILSVPVPMWQCSVIWSVSACTNVVVFCCVIISVPVPKWQCSVVWYCQCQYKYGSALCDWNLCLPSVRSFKIPCIIPALPPLDEAHFFSVFRLASLLLHVHRLMPFVSVNLTAQEMIHSATKAFCRSLK